ncbi:MAG: DUF3078 domain-containing protein [Saprospiraceae bacterium]|nr:DUF3078 domain-containing protein [Saprospiraceae bacterium]
MNTQLAISWGFTILFVVFYGQASLATSQQTDLDTSHWRTKPTLGLFFSQHSFSPYYKGGGVNSMALGSHLDLSSNFERGKNRWENRLIVRYGVIKVADQAMQKNEDHLEINSKYGHSFSEHLQVTGMLNFSSRIHDVYELNKKNVKGKRSGNFLSPAYINVGTGLDYRTKDKAISIFYTPVNSKITIVTDQDLAAQYLGGETDRMARYELGSLLKFEVKKEIMENITVHAVGTLFTNHLHHFGKIDVNLENSLKFRVNKFFSINLLTHLAYDEDVLFDIIKEDIGEDVSTPRKGPRTQFKEVLNIGLSHTF